MKTLEDICTDGYILWRKNLRLSVPFILSAFMKLAMAFIFLVVYAFAIAPSLEGILAAAIPLALIGIYMFLFLLVESYFYSGALGMARSLVTGGGINPGQMTEYANEVFVNVFIINLIVFFSSLAVAVVFMVIPYGLIAAVPDLAFILRGFADFGTQLTSIFSLMVGVLFVLAPLCAVFERKGAIESMRDSYGRVMENKARFLILWFLLKSVAEYLTLTIILISVGLLSFGLLMLNIPPSLMSKDISSMQDYLPSMLLPAGLYSLALLAAFIITLAAAYLVIIRPLSAILWSMFYLGNGREK